jgi:hypothetical protein
MLIESRSTLCPKNGDNNSVIIGDIGSITETKLKKTNNSASGFTGRYKCTRECIFCNDWHFPEACSKTLEERKTIIAGMKRCTNCFSPETRKQRLHIQQELLQV